MASTSKVSICNTALTMIGADRINSFDEDTSNARACNAIYDQLRKEELISHPWNFATERVQLAQLSSTPAYGFNYEFSLPTDYLRIIAVQYDYAYRVEDFKLRSDQAPFRCEYIKDVEDVSEFSYAFIQLLTARLALELCYPISNSASLTERMEARYLQKRKWATSADSQEGTPRSIYDDSWTGARYSGLSGERYDKNYGI